MCRYGLTIGIPDCGLENWIVLNRIPDTPSKFGVMTGALSATEEKIRMIVDIVTGSWIPSGDRICRVPMQFKISLLGLGLGAPTFTTGQHDKLVFCFLYIKKTPGGQALDVVPAQ